MKLILLTNFIPPSNLELFQCLQKHFPEMEFWLSTPMEKDRKWAKNWEGLQVKTQFSLSLNRKQKSAEGIEFSTYLHLPIFSFFALLWAAPKVVIASELGFRSLSALLYRIIFQEITSNFVVGLIGTYRKRQREMANPFAKMDTQKIRCRFCKWQ
jgi:hypothetical protein